jgi:hypothetical protein
MPPRVSIDAKRRRLELLKSGKKELRGIHCKECHASKSDENYQRHNGTRIVHGCPKKKCLKLSTCRAVTEKKRREFHEMEALEEEIAAAVALEKESSLPGDDDEEDESLRKKIRVHGASMNDDKVDPSLFGTLMNEARSSKKKILKKAKKFAKCDQPKVNY